MIVVYLLINIYKIIMKLYNEFNKRLYIEKQMIFSSSKNILSFVKYYDKKGFNLKDKISQIDKSMDSIDCVENVEDLLLIEARIKQIYYVVWDIILENEQLQI